MHLIGANGTWFAQFYHTFSFAKWLSYIAFAMYSIDDVYLVFGNNIMSTNGVQCRGCLF